MAVSKPNEMGRYFPAAISPSIVFGIPITLQSIPSVSRYSAMNAAFVLESSPPTTTRPSSLFLTTVCLTFSNCSGLLIFVLSVPRKSNPPILMMDLMSSLFISKRSPLIRPFGPFLIPNRVLSFPSDGRKTGEHVMASRRRTAREEHSDSFPLDRCRIHLRQRPPERCFCSLRSSSERPRRFCRVPCK